MLVAMATRTGISMWSEETGGEEQHQHETVIQLETEKRILQRTGFISGVL
jgi:hypothetical protein